MEAIKIYFTIVYAKNTNTERATLLCTLVSSGKAIQEPWSLSGNFNFVLSTEDRLGSFVTPGET